MEKLSQKDCAGDLKTALVPWFLQLKKDILSSGCCPLLFCSLCAQQLMTEGEVGNNLLLQQMFNVTGTGSASLACQNYHIHSARFFI